MRAFHQMAHDSKNLVLDPKLAMFSGVVFSPVNYNEEQCRRILAALPSNLSESVFDPQLYFPRSERGKLREWGYFPEDVDSADTTSIGWWNDISQKIVSQAKALQVSSLATPALVPKAFTNDYYRFNVSIADDAYNQASDSGIECLQTILVSMSEITLDNRVDEIVSICTGSRLDRAYLVFVSDLNPRNEYSDTDQLRAALQLIHRMQEAGMRILIAYCSSDVAVWASAAVDACATGKFFNARRFTQSRFADQAEGGGQVPYWFEESLMAYLRSSDLIRVRDANLLSSSSQSNPYGQEILAQMQAEPDKAWVRLSWRQYLHWFSDFSVRVSVPDFDIDKMLEESEKNWLHLKAKKVLMEKPENNGDWLRPWRRAIIEA